MEDVLDVYHRPSDPKRPVVGLDEKPMQLLSDVRGPLPPAPGRPARQDYEYRRNGTANVFCAFEPLANWRQLAVTGRRTRVDFARFVKGLVDGPYRDADAVVLVMDNLNTHSPAGLYEAFGPEEARRIARKLEIHHTPRHGSWLNVAEVELSVLGRRRPERIPDPESLAAHAAAVERERNDAGRGCDWRFTTPDARIRLKRLYPTIEVR
jgi:DDE superfamily endonuclease